MKRICEMVSGARVLAIGAHPDDIELGAGGLVARLAQHGAEVTMVIASVPSHFEARKSEAAAGARVLGANHLILYPDSPCRVENIPMYKLVGRLDQVIGDIRPHMCITHAAVDLHWDHRLLHHATLSALRRTPCDLLAFLSSPEMNAHTRSIGQFFADISETIDVKMKAIAAHGTQLEGARFDLEAARDLARAMGRASGVNYAESYEVLRMTF